jgi:hypothetical protein
MTALLSSIIPPTTMPPPPILFSSTGMSCSVLSKMASTRRKNRIAVAS